MISITRRWRRPLAVAAGTLTALTAVAVGTTAARQDAGATAFGNPDWCLEGFVWRDAHVGVAIDMNLAALRAAEPRRRPVRPQHLPRRLRLA
jgi:hypothetical protein